jgi:hypothetical protein
MRLRSLNAISFLTAVGCIAVVAAHPPLRHRVLSALHPATDSVDFRAIAQSRQDDADAWLAALPSRDLPLAERLRIYRRASDLAPDSAAPHIIFAGFALDRVPLRREEENAVWPDVPWDLKTHERYLRKSQRDALGLAQDALDQAAELEPDNAAADYLRAYISLTNHDDDVALDLLRSALDKQTLNLHMEDVALAAHQVVGSLAPPFEAAVSACVAAPSTLFNGEFRSLSRVLTGISVLAEQRGDHDQAIFLRRAVMHLARLLLAGPGDTIRGHTGWAIWQVAASRELSDAESAEVRAAIPRALEGQQSREQVSALSRGLRAARHAKFAQYLRDHGYSRLADEVVALADLHPVWSERARTISGITALALRLPALTFGLRQTLHALAGTLAVLLLCIPGGLVLRLRRRPAHPITWPPIGWLLVVYGCMAAAYLVGLLRPDGESVTVPAETVLGFTAWTCPAWGSYFAVIGVPLLIGSAVAVVILHRRRHPEARDIGPVRHYLGTVVSILLPLTALLCLVALGFAIPSAAYAARCTPVYQATMEQGELAHYGLNIPLVPTEP